jgi:hypothetical protein
MVCKKERIDRKPATNSTYKKLAVQWLNEALCFVSSLVLADNIEVDIEKLKRNINKEDVEFEEVSSILF